MKKLILILLAVLLLAACGQDKENDQEAVYVNITAEEAVGKILFYFLSAARNIYYRKIIRNTAVFLQKIKYVLRGVSQPSVNITGIRKPKACRRMLTVVEHSLTTTRKFCVLIEK